LYSRHLAHTIATAVFHESQPEGEVPASRVPSGVK
jgi:hypothetical protein